MRPKETGKKRKPGKEKGGWSTDEKRIWIRKPGIQERKRGSKVKEKNGLGLFYNLFFLFLVSWFPYKFLFKKCF